MREIRKSGLTRGSNGIGASRPLLSTLLAFVVSIYGFRFADYEAMAARKSVFEEACTQEIARLTALQNAQWNIAR